MSVESDLGRTFRHARHIGAGLVGLSVVLYLASGLYSIDPEQRGVVRRLGRVVADDVAPGIHYHLPWPIETVDRPRTTEVRSLTVAFDALGSAPARTDDLDALLTGDGNLVLAKLLVQYTIKKPAEFLFGTADPERMLSRIVRDAAIERFARANVDEVLTTGRQELQLRLRDDVQAAADALRLGIRLTAVQIEKLEPPAPVASAFKDVGSAREDKQKAIEEAEGDRNRRLPEARAQAERTRSEAQAAAREAVDFARGDADRFVAAWTEYRRARSVTARRVYLETLEEVLPRVRKIVANPRADASSPALPR